MIIKAIIEMPAGTCYKYESNGKGDLVLDRVLNQKVPFNYGYVPNTLCGDGDPLDIFVVSSVPLLPTAKVKVEVVGGFYCMDSRKEDNKLIGYLSGDPIFLHIVDLHRAVLEYLNTYKKSFKVRHSMTIDEAYAIYMSSKTAKAKLL